MVFESASDDTAAGMQWTESSPNPWDGRQSLREAQNLNTLILNSSAPMLVFTLDTPLAVLTSE